MKFARAVFWIAGAFGAAAIIPLYRTPGSATYYGLLATLVAWQVAFFLIGWNPKQFRLLMIPAVLEKALWMLTLLVLYTKGQTTRPQLAANAATHGLLGVLFVVAFIRTARAK
ncbi:MAG: hypothetical protein ABSE45_15830 [Candidatus Acidiferrales bacterium]|jgi:hypothetical protein